MDVASSCQLVSTHPNSSSNCYPIFASQSLETGYVGADTYNTNIIQKHIRRISELPSDRRTPQHGVHALRIARDGRSAEMLDKLADAHPFARGAELLFRGFKGRDGGRGAVRAVEVPREEAGEVL
jgi:hypothetical protein